MFVQISIDAKTLDDVLERLKIAKQQLEINKVFAHNQETKLNVSYPENGYLKVEIEN